jgi:hypothetical protein
MTSNRSFVSAIGWLTLCAAACDRPAATPAVTLTPDSAANELLAADRAFAAAAANTDLVSALAAMFAPGIIVPAPGGVFAEGIDSVLAVIRSNPDNERSRAEWSPIRAGVSADARHGFTLGYFTTHRPDSTKAFSKYLAYWEKQQGTWRVLAWKRGGTDAVRDTLLPPSLPERVVQTTGDSATLEQYRLSLAEAERAFSSDAQAMGLRAAFRQYGSPDAVNMGAPDGPFLIGATAVSEGVSNDSTGSPVSWGPDYRVIVASSGDLGITFGFIRSNQPAAGRPPFPFFTIWRRPSPGDPWRYIAE